MKNINKENAKMRLLGLIKQVRDQDYELEGDKDSGYKIIASRKKVRTLVIEDKIDYFLDEFQKYIMSTVDQKMIKLAQEHRDALKQLKSDREKINQLESEVSKLKDTLAKALKLIKTI